MSGWGGGYITDITYMAGWYRQQSPAMMAIAALLGNVNAGIPAPDDAISYLELGCGQGYGAMLLAASNPKWTVTAIDFNPAHIAEARAWAAEAGLTNIRFLEADLSTLADEAQAATIPEADFVSLHGLWTWVPPAVQAGVVKLLAAKVRPGGVVHISYNVLPGWGPAMGMQRLLREGGNRLAFRSDQQVERAVTLAKDLLAAGAPQFTQSPLTRHLLDRMHTMPVSYLAHEYMNASWKPCFHSEVAAALSAAKLDWVASSQLPENFGSLMFTPEQQEILNRFDDPIMRELIKDTCVDRLLRHDVFVRGARRLSPVARNDALMDVSISLNINPADMPAEADFPVGKADLNAAFYGPIAQALTHGPRKVGDLLEIPELVGSRDNPAEMIGILIGLDLAEPAIRRDAAPGEQARAFNRVAAKNYLGTTGLSRGVGLASHRLGGGTMATVLDLMIMTHAMNGETDIDTLSGYVNAPPEQAEKVREIVRISVEDKQPRLRAAGVW